MKILKVKSILFSLMAIGMLTVLLTSCQKESYISEIEIDELKPLDSFNENARYPWTHVNPQGFTYTNYVASAFCDNNGNGEFDPNLDPQIQIWTSTFENCECMLNQFLSECGDNLISFSACYQKTSNYPPDPEVCTI